MTTKRINLSFSIDREDDLKVYRILSEQKYKTDYVINAVLSYIGERDKGFDKEKIKEAVKEAIEECGGISIENKGKENNSCVQHELPDNIFDMFDNL
jgi:lipoate-protein ligase A